MRAWLFLPFLLAACSGLKTYPTDPGGNLAVRSQMESGVRAALHVHRIDRQCHTEYQGTVQLDSPAMPLALPVGQPSYLMVAFDTSSLLGGRRSTSAGAMLTPRAGSRYELAVRYRDSIYEVALYEIDGRGRRALPRYDLDACPARS